MTLVQVKLELGHRAEFRQKPTKEGFTHDWVVFVRGPQDKPIQNFVDKVVFYLHESFAKPKRVVRDPPYQIKESGYAGFTLPIEVYFKNKDEPKKICFEYDLFLHLENCPPVNHIRCEKLTFQNPTEEFQKKLTKAGGILVSQPNLSPPHNQGQGLSNQATPMAQPEILTSNSTHRQDSESGASKQPSKMPPAKVGPAPNDMSFTSLFGAPLKPSHQSSSLKAPLTNKEPGVSLQASMAHSSTSSQQPLPKKILGPSVVNSSVSTNNNNVSINKPVHTKPKPAGPPLQAAGSVTAETAHNRKQGGFSHSHGNGPAAALLPAPCKDLKMGGIAKENAVKSVTKPSISPAPSHTPPHQSPPRGKDLPVKNNEVKKRLPHSNGHPISNSLSTATTTSSAFSQSSASALKHHKENRKKRERGEGEDLTQLSPNIAKRKIAPSVDPIPNKPEGISDIRQQHQHIRPEMPRSNHTIVEAPSEPLPSPLTRSNTSSSAEETFQDGRHSTNPLENQPPNNTNHNSNNNTNSSSVANPLMPTASFSREYVDDLLSLQQDLMSLQDRHLVQRIVDVIVETRKYTISPSTFDFDLCRLEKSTVARIKEILLA